MYTVRLQEFEGPLDLLWQLIQDQKLDLNQIALAQVAGEFLRRVLEAEEEEKIGLDEMVDFLAVAAKLLYLKSKIFAPEKCEEDDDLEGGAEDLETQLRIYKEYIVAGQKLAAMWADERQSFERDNYAAREAGFYPPTNLKIGELTRAMESLLRRLKPKKLLPQQVIRRVLSLRQRIMEIQARLGGGNRFKFSHLLEAAHGSSEVVVTFLALLEMSRQNQVVLAQTGHLQEIEITKLEINNTD